MPELKPETEAAIRAAFIAVAEAVYLLEADPGRDRRFEGGSVTPSSLNRSKPPIAELTLTVRPGVADTFAEAFTEDRSRA
jgi:hypothetical protein